MFSVDSFICYVVFAMRLISESVNSIFTFLVVISVLYCTVIEVFGSVRIRSKSLVVSVCSLTRIGRRFCSFGIRLDGFVIWNALEAINRMWLVLIISCLVETV